MIYLINIKYYQAESKYYETFKKLNFILEKILHFRLLLLYNKFK